ncbi:MAG: hypothetical protein JXC32_02320 [Anaerolineae bacterium]|nr:hypothetical protein [Anaerolineae bacterium]
MGTLSRTQKIILLVLAFLDFVVIGGLVAIMVTSSRAPAQAPPTPTARATKNIVATWTPRPTETPRPTLPARLTNTPTPTGTPVPTLTPTETPTPRPPEPVTLNGADFDFIMPNRIPGWDWDAYVNYKDGDEYNPENSYAEPLFTAADDPAREINGRTLKVETVRWLKYRAWVHQTVTLTAGSRVTFQIRAKAYSSLDSLIVKAGIDPTGADDCHNAIWGTEARINQDSGTVLLSSPQVTVRPQPEATEVAEDEDTDERETGAAEEVAQGRVTLCFFAEPAYPHINNAAFFDRAELIVSPPR